MIIESNYHKEGKQGILYCRSQTRTQTFKDFCSCNFQKCLINKCFRDIYFSDPIENRFTSLVNTTVLLGHYLLLAAEQDL